MCFGLCVFISLFFFDATATTELYTYCHTLSLHDALPIFLVSAAAAIIACAATTQEAPKASVEAPKVPFTETRYGRTVDDPYRWMEDPKRASELARYVREQSNITIEQLADLPQRDRLVDLIDAEIGRAHV